MRENRTKRKGRISIFMLLGILLVGGALALTLYNVWTQEKAERDSMKVAEEMRVVLEEDALDEADSEADPVEEEDHRPDYEKNPDMPMPTMEIDGRTYIGILDVPELDLSLPIMEEWSESGLKIAPGRYDGSVYKKDLIIAGHNYRRHFSQVKRLDTGAVVTFTDAVGNVFAYEMTYKETIDADRSDLMYEGDWDLTLFTCDYGGENRVAMRFRLTSSTPVAS